MRKSGHSSSRQRTLARFAAVAIAVCLVLAGLYALGRYVEKSAYREERGVMSEGFGLLHTIEYQGVTYTQRTDVTSILLIGTDRGTRERSSGFRRGGQADFLTLVALDHQSGTIYQLQIDRDTLTDVTTLGAFGNETGTRSMQISLAHGFGENEADNCRYTVRAAQNLLAGANIGFYMALDMGDIPALNAALGGVAVTFPEDYTDIDPLMTLGGTLRLTGEQAQALVRARMSVGDGTNVSRMRRQRVYADAAIAALRAGVRESAEYAAQLLDTLNDAVTTDMPRIRMLNEINHSGNYTIAPVDSLTGEHALGSDGFMEFRADREDILAWVTRVLYAQKE